MVKALNIVAFPLALLAGAAATLVWDIPQGIGVFFAVWVYLMVDGYDSRP